MQIRFVSELPLSAAPLARLVARDGVEAGLSGQPEEARLRAAVRAQRFEGNAGTLVDQIMVTNAGEPQRLLLAGTGGGGVEDLERAGGALAAHLLRSGEIELVVDARGQSADHAARLAGGLAQRGWAYDKYRTRLPDNRKTTLVDVIIVADAPGVAQAWARQEAVVAGVAFARKLVTEPGNVIYPESFVAECQALAKLGVDIEVLDEAAMAAAGMGALLGVAQGSAKPPRLLVLRWNGLGSDADVPVVFVGKGVTFDTGGISLKPPAGMEDMKWDMGGAAAVAGAMMALAGRKAPAHVVGICGLVENMPDGHAQRPGDVVTTLSGQTVEVINTDAEGRLVLCDALTWAQRRFSPKVVIDLATLTGAMIISLGHEQGGLFANDDTLAGQLMASGKAAGDPLWRMPLGEAYDKLIDSPIADIKNVGPREAGSITAAQFLQRFIDKGVAWAHLDIAGMVWAGKPGTLWDKGATGYGVRLLDRFIADHHEG